ncbi:hypothetical protein Pint_19202 [Pistacia integerrima]|uniref:Uncharacterized protein n=1 Tax=Pistacia integerrima TaxID=434235 RepID=A0ACC0YWT2_9ROSI|nr:hypothetical protein Pint_19202 [Pistacia integerrima]
MRPNEYIFATVLFSCSRSGKVEEGKQCHGYVMKSGLAFHQYVRSALIDLYAKCQDMGMAMQVFNALPGYDVFSYNSILNGLLEHGYMREGVEVLSRMVNECVNWDTTTYVNAFGICACLKDLKLGLSTVRYGDVLHALVEKSGFKEHVIVGNALITMKPSELLEVGSILRDQVPVIRRFTGGGTVVVDNGTVFVTLICNKDAVPGVQPYPRSVMYWSGLLYNEVFRGTGDFQLLENDYVFGDRKFGGNAQSITKNRWIHHTSFLWDYKVGNMAYLKQPARAPKYRLARDHTKFICRMKDYMPRSVFIENTIEAIETYFSVQPANLEAIDTSSEANFVHSTRLLTKQELEEACESQLENIGVNV